METREFKKSKNQMFRMLAMHLAIGVGTGWAILTFFFVTDVAGLRTLASQSHLEFIVYPLLYIFFAITFGSTAMGIGAMSANKKDDDDDHKGGGKKPQIISNNAIGDFGNLVPVKVRTNPHNRR